MISLHDGALDAHVAGNKAATLSRLAHAGFPVPPGFVVSPDVAVDRAALTVALPALGRRVAVRSSGLAEDSVDASHAGLYETMLDVDAIDVVDAIARCRASAAAPRVTEYHANHGVPSAPIAVLVQRMVDAVVSGVAFTADPVTGDRSAVRVAAVKGLGERLVSGEATPDEWDVHGTEAHALGTREGALDAAGALRIAELARRLEAHLAQGPLDIEWAVDPAGALHVLQARPITTLPDDAEWSAPPGSWARYFRLGEWLTDAVTPLFATWALPRLEREFWTRLTAETSVPAPTPQFSVIHGWYFGSLEFWPRTMPRTIAWILTHPRVLRMFVQSVPALVERATRRWLEAWEAELPEHLALAASSRSIEGASIDALTAEVDQLVDAAGRYFVWIALVAGAGYKTEVPFAELWAKRVAPKLARDGHAPSHQELLVGLGALDVVDAPAVASLDWYHPPLESDEATLSRSAADVRRAELASERDALEARARAVLSAREARTFDRLLERARRYARLRERVVAGFTAGWPRLRRLVLAIGAQLVRDGHLSRAEDVFFVERAELGAPRAADVQARRSTWRRQRRLTPPWSLGAPPAIWGVGQSMMAKALRGVDPHEGDGAAEGVLRGVPASPGLATGPARILRGLDELDRVRPGDVLIAPATAPAWTPLFAKIAAVVTDSGSPMAHASLVAREYGIPAVVAAGDATRRFRDGERVTVDGHRGTVVRAKR
jgi:phosphohistidine swiveling domain-containing protein